MWVKVDDRFPDHRKVFAAGDALGPHSTGRVLAVWLEAMCWTNFNGTDGELSIGVVRTFKHDRQPLKVAQAMALPVRRPDGSMGPGLFIAQEGGFRVHDYHELNDREKFEAKSAARAEAGRNGGRRSGESRREAKLKQTAKQLLQQTGSKPEANGQANTNPVPVPTDQQVKEQPAGADAPPVHQFFHRWAERFEEKAGQRPEFDRGKDAKTAKDLIDRHGIDEVLANVDEMFRSRDSWIRQSGYTVGAFKACFNKLTLARQAAPRNGFTAGESWRDLCVARGHHPMCQSPTKCELLHVQQAGAA